jgi:tetratricopeptide (TPR) repeat protein
MDGLTEFEFDRERLLAAVGLRPEHSAEFQRLLKLLIYGPRFQLLAAEANNGDYRALLIEKINQFVVKLGLRVGRLQLDPDQYPDVAAMERMLEALAKSSDLIHIEGGEFWFDVPRWQSFNVRREAIAQSAPARLLFWLNTEPIRLFAEYAPDSWAWRSGVFSFLSPQTENALVGEVRRLIESSVPAIDNRTLAERTNRIAQLQAVLIQTPQLARDLALPLLDELAGLYADLGDVQEALRIRQAKQLPLALDVGERNGIASVKWQIARNWIALGQSAKGVALLRTEVLPVFRETGDQRRSVIVLVEIAQAADDNDNGEAALRSLREEVLPFFKKSGEQRSIGNTFCNMAVVLLNRGELDRAFEMFQNQAFPIFLELDDRRSMAITKLNMAVILQRRGEYDEALRVYQQEVLPIFFDLGLEHLVVDVHIKIGLLLLSLGNAEKALDLLREQVLPILLRMGSVRQLASIRHLMAHCLTNLNQFSEAVTLLEKDVLPVYEDLKMLPEIAAVRSELTKLHAHIASNLNPQPS